MNLLDSWFLSVIFWMMYIAPVHIKFRIQSISQTPNFCGDKCILCYCFSYNDSPNFFKILCFKCLFRTSCCNCCLATKNCILRIINEIIFQKNSSFSHHTHEIWIYNHQWDNFSKKIIILSSYPRGGFKTSYYHKTHLK